MLPVPLFAHPIVFDPVFQFQPNLMENRGLTDITSIQAEYKYTIQCLKLNGSAQAAWEPCTWPETRQGVLCFMQGSSMAWYRWDFGSITWAQASLGKVGMQPVTADSTAFRAICCCCKAGWQLALTGSRPTNKNRDGRCFRADCALPHGNKCGAEELSSAARRGLRDAAQWRAQLGERSGHGPRLLTGYQRRGARRAWGWT